MDSNASSLRAVVARASRGLVDREVLVDLVLLGAVAGEHLLVVGPPGTAKSEAARRVARALGLRYFEYLLGRFTEPNEIFGPVDLKRLREGVVEIATSGMLPEAEIAFLDEVFLGSTAILNGLLAVLNERTFRRGATVVACPLRMCIGASNALPEDETLAAFADRFLLRSFLRSLPEPRIEELLEAGWSLDHETKADAASDPKTLDAMSARAKQVDLAEVRPAIAHAVRSLRKDGIVLSDRRTVRSQRVIAAAAALAGRDVASEADLWPLLYVVPTAEAQIVARETLRELLAASESATLGAAAEDASSSAASRAARLIEEIEAALGAKPEERAAKARWKASLEGIAREVDAGFTKDAMSEALRASREELVAAIDEPDAP